MKLLHKIYSQEGRKEKKKAGHFDGRFKTRSIPSKKTYSRKNKHPHTNILS